MSYQHQELASGRWFSLTFFEQMANIGSEVSRALAWRDKNLEYSTVAAERALELLDLTLADQKNVTRLRELARVRESLADFFWGQNSYSSSGQLWNSYFYPFNWAARNTRIV